jgi:hypothetical protein
MYWPLLAMFILVKRSRDRDVEVLLRYCVEELKVLRNGSILVDDSVNVISDQVEVTRQINFGEEPTIDDVKRALIVVYGEEMAQVKLAKLFESVVDDGTFSHHWVQMPQGNEIVTATPEQLTQAMREETERYYGSEGL